jgi:hypothetical protein
VYNLIVEGEFHFLANGALAHSFAYFRTTRSWAWTFFGWLKSQTSLMGQGADKEYGSQGMVNHCLEKSAR